MWLIMQSKLLDQVPIEEALRSTFEETDEQWIQEARSTDDDSGTSAIVCLIIDLEIYTANVGDGSATVYNAQQQPLLLSTTHPHDSSAESQQIIAQVGSIDSISGLPGCVNGLLPVSRGLGCQSLTQFLSAEPSIKRRGILETDQALILATNGLNVLSATQVSELAASAVKDAEAVAYWLCETAAASGLQENLTVLVIHLSSVLTGPASRYTSLTGSPMNAIVADSKYGDKRMRQLDDEKEEVTMQQ